MTGVVHSVIAAGGLRFAIAETGSHVRARSTRSTPGHQHGAAHLRRLQRLCRRRRRLDSGDGRGGAVRRPVRAPEPVVRGVGDLRRHQGAVVAPAGWRQVGGAADMWAGGVPRFAAPTGPPALAASAQDEMQAASRQAGRAKRQVGATATSGLKRAPASPRRTSAAGAACRRGAWTAAAGRRGQRCSARVRVDAGWRVSAAANPWWAARHAVRSEWAGLWAQTRCAPGERTGADWCRRRLPLRVRPWPLPFGALHHGGCGHWALTAKCRRRLLQWPDMARSTHRQAHAHRCGPRPLATRCTPRAGAGSANSPQAQVAAAGVNGPQPTRHSPPGAGSCCCWRWT